MANESIRVSTTVTVTIGLQKYDVVLTLTRQEALKLVNDLQAVLGLDDHIPKIPSPITPIDKTFPTTPYYPHYPLPQPWCNPNENWCKTTIQ